ncbi:transferase [Iris pallida]|uniref:Transferase n=1 Tax=Iris pallida TaxID=29817 RepID=A0AAX6ERL6_IRIPA|nr:transferase [Iris pallida]
MTAGCERQVTVQAKWTAVSSTPVRPGKMYPLSVLDHAMAAHTLHMIFYYRPAPSTLTREKLYESLSDVLSHYPAVTGRLVRDGADKWAVKCNDAGVRMHDAKVALTLDEWFKSATAEDERDLTYWEPMVEDPSIWSPFYIQITEFKDNAFAIGLSLPHMHADPACAALVIKAWGDAHRRSYIVNPPFFHPPGLLPRPQPNLSTQTAKFLANKSQMAAAASTTTTRCRMSSATFRFSEEAVKSCFSQMHSADDDCTKTTPFDILAALFWLSISSSSSGGPAAALTLCVEFRKSMHAPLPYGFFGNALHFSKVEADLTSGWDSVAAAINRHLAGLEEEAYWSGIEWLNGNAQKPFQMYGPELTFIKMDHLLAYGAVFEKEGGGGKPVHVACRLGGVEGEGVVIVMPAAEEGMGRTVAVTLPEEAMEKLCKDDNILRHGPTIMFRG